MRVLVVTFADPERAVCECVQVIGYHVLSVVTDAPVLNRVGLEIGAALVALISLDPNEIFDIYPPTSD